MPENATADRDALLQEITVSYERLLAALDSWTDEQLTVPTDAAGWTVKDHLTHLTACERSIVFLLNGQPRHEGLGVPEEVYLRAADDDYLLSNAMIRDQHAHLTAAAARAAFVAIHQQLLALLGTLTDADLQQPYAAYRPATLPQHHRIPIRQYIVGDTSEHYAEHLPWMEQIVRTAPAANPSA